VAPRDAERTKGLILAAAEDLFAERGFDAASMHEIAAAAGVARATPAYFYGSKQALYEAVLARVVSRAQQAMARAYAEANKHTAPEVAVDSYIGAFLDFLAHDQNFVRLIQREALGDVSRVADFFGQPVDDAITAFTPAAKQARISPQRLVLDLVALCWYPFAHEHTLLPALGMKARDPAFIDEHKRHVAKLVQALTRANA